MRLRRRDEPGFSPDQYDSVERGTLRCWLFLSDTAIALDSLNIGLLPPPGEPGSPFTPLPELDGLILAPGAEVEFAVSEPSTLTLLWAALGGLCARRQWQRRGSIGPTAPIG